MKQNRIFLVLCATLAITSYANTNHQLPEAPQKIDQFQEIAALYNPKLPELYNNLTPQERVFAYYIHRASLPGNLIAADQTHRHAVTMIDMFSFMVEHQELLRAEFSDQFVEQLKVYAVYLWTNHSNYFAREHRDEKRTPQRLELELLTEERIIQALELLDYPDAHATIKTIAPSLFDENIEPTASIPGDIEKSSCNIYSPDFTEDDYQSLSADQRNSLNSYYGVTEENGVRTAYAKLYCMQGHYAKELAVSAFWLQKAHEIAQKYPEQFDASLTKSLEYLILFLQNGDEELFRKHSIEWLNSNSRIDYTFGFIETYRDPKQHCASFEADVTIKAVNIESLNAILPQLEQQLPFPDEYKRTNLEDLSAIPNASVNAILHSTGELGPLNIIAAYCLPNYEDIRAKYGSKQIMYQSGKGAGEQLNPDLHRTLSNLRAEAAWRSLYDPEGNLSRDIWDVHVVLHETLGHGSGKADYHIFKEGDPLTIQDVVYTIGDVIPVTNENLTEFLKKRGAALEELRAEIIALYTSIFIFDELASAGLFKEWPQKVGKEKLIEKMILAFAHTGLYRLINQPNDATIISGAHALANSTITNYLLDHGGIELVEETHVIDGKQYTVPGFILTDLDKTLSAIETLAVRVQTIKSTADGVDCEALIGFYGEVIRNPKYIAILKENRDAISNGIKVSARIFPTYTPVVNDGKIVDIAASWPESIVEQCLSYRELALSKEL